MQRQNLYRFKLLKQRDGDFSRSQIRINLNPTYLTLSDQFIDVNHLFISFYNKTSKVSFDVFYLIYIL